MRPFTGAVPLSATVFLAAAVGLSGCFYSSRETEKVTPTPTAVVVQGPERVITYPGGRYELHGNGTANSPYYWVWVPNGEYSVPPAPPPAPISDR